MGRIGAHIRTAGGLALAVGRAVDIGAECLQIFAGSPQAWAQPSYKQHDVDSFRAKLSEHDIRPLFLHGPYLVNLASLRDDVRRKSESTLVGQLEWAERLGAVGVVIHVGSGGENAMEQAVSGIGKVLQAYPGPANLILENDAGSGNRIGRTFAELGEIMRSLGLDERLRLCLDTAHALAAGYEIRTEEGLAQAVVDVDREVGLGRLVLVHANDSKADLGTNRDRHENVGEGKIGAAAFRRILRDPSLGPLPFVTEVPGFDGNGPDRRGVDLLRDLARGNGESDAQCLVRAAGCEPSPNRGPDSVLRTGAYQLVPGGI